MICGFPAMHGHGHIAGLRQLKQRLMTRVIQIHILVTHVKLYAQAMGVALKIILKLHRRFFRIVRGYLFTLHAQAVTHVVRLVIRLRAKRLSPEVDKPGRHPSKTAGCIVTVAHGDRKGNLICFANFLPAPAGVFMLRQLGQFIEAFNFEIMHVRVNNHLLFPLRLTVFDYI